MKNKVKVLVLKKDSILEGFNADKIIKAIGLSAKRVNIKLTDAENSKVLELVENEISKLFTGDENLVVSVKKLHSLVQSALHDVNLKVFSSYVNYRHVVKGQLESLNNIYNTTQKVLYHGDKDNANADSTLVSTKRALIGGEANKEMYLNYLVNENVRKAIKFGAIYVHDLKDRILTYNCCLLDVAKILKNGFELGNIRLAEGKTLEVIGNQLKNIIFSAAAQQYGK